MRHWTAEQRARQSAAIRRWAPWEHSTGPRTPEGKARVSRNAFTGSMRLWFRAVDVVFAMYRRNPGAQTLAECRNVTMRERAAVETTVRLSPSARTIEEKTVHLTKALK